MNAPLTRRSLLGATALGVIGLPAAAGAVIPALDPDADLFALLDRWRATRDAWDATDEPLEQAHARALAAYPPRPDALRPVFGDMIVGVWNARPDTGREQGPDGRTRGFYSADDVEILRRAGPITMDAGLDDNGELRPRTPSPAGEARRLAIVAAHDDWMADRKAVEDAVGYMTASNLAEERAEAWVVVDDALRLCGPRTLAGIARKAAWVANCLSRDIGHDDIGEVFARQVATFGGVAT